MEDYSFHTKCIACNQDVNTEQTMPHDVESIYVGISRLTQLEDLQIWPIDLGNPKEIEHLLKLKRDG